MKILCWLRVMFIRWYCRWKKSGIHQLRLVVYPYCLQGFIHWHPKCCMIFVPSTVASDTVAIFRRLQQSCRRFQHELSHQTSNRIKCYTRNSWDIGISKTGIACRLNLVQGYGQETAPQAPFEDVEVVAVVSRRLYCFDHESFSKIDKAYAIWL